MYTCININVEMRNIYHYCCLNRAIVRRHLRHVQDHLWVLGVEVHREGGHNAGIMFSLLQIQSVPNFSFTGVRRCGGRWFPIFLLMEIRRGPKVILIGRAVERYRTQN